MDKVKAIVANPVVSLFLTVGAAIIIALLVQAYLVKPYRIPSGSMKPTLAIGQRVLTNRLVYHFQDPEPGDIIVFHPPLGANGGQGCADPTRNTRHVCSASVDTPDQINFIKRIVAGPGDTVAILDGHPIVNGTTVDEPFTNECHGQGCNFPDEVTIPEGHYFVMGDNRGASFDSRFWGPLPEEWIIGRAFATYWPPDRVGGL